MEFRVLGNFEVVRDGQSSRPRGVQATRIASAAPDRTELGLLHRPDPRRAVGYRRRHRQAEHALGLRLRIAQGARARAREAHRGHDPAHPSPGLPHRGHPDEVDALRFEQMVFEGRALADVDPPAASLVLGEALALWRGRAFEDFTYEAFAHAEIARLEELRLEAVELRVDADLAAGSRSRAGLGVGVARTSASAQRSDCRES